MLCRSSEPSSAQLMALLTLWVLTVGLPSPHLSTLWAYPPVEAVQVPIIRFPWRWSQQSWVQLILHQGKDETCPNPVVYIYYHVNGHKKSYKNRCLFYKHLILDESHPQSRWVQLHSLCYLNQRTTSGSGPRGTDWPASRLLKQGSSGADDLHP